MASAMPVAPPSLIESPTEPAPRFAPTAELHQQAAQPWLRWLPLVAVFLLGLALRLPNYLSPNVYVDEANTWYATQKSSLLHYLAWRHHKEHPPALYMVEDALITLFGDGLPVLRLPGLVAGLLCLPMAYLFARRVAGHAAGVWMALLLAVDPNMVQQSGFARMYTPLMLVLLALFWLLVRILRDRRGGRWSWAGVGVLLAALIWTSTVGLAILAGVTVAIATLTTVPALRRTIDARRAVAGGAAALVLAVALCSVGLFTRSRGPAPFEPTTFAHQLAYLAHAVSQISGWVVVWPVALLAGVAGLAILARRQPVAVTFVAGVAIANLVGVFILLMAFHHADARHLTAAQPALWLGWAALPSAAVTLPWRRLAAPLVLALAGVQAWNSTHLLDWYPRPASYAASSAIEYVRDRGFDGKTLVLWPGWYYATPAYLDMRLSWDVQAWHRLKDGPFPADEPPEVPLPRRLAFVSVVHGDSLAHEGRALAQLFATELGLRLPDEQLEGHFRKEHVTAVTYEGDRIEVATFTPHQWRAATPDHHAVVTP